MLEAGDRPLRDSAGAVGKRSAVSTDDAIAAKLQALGQMDYAALHDKWRRLYRALPPKRVSRNLLVLGVAWKIQEKACGGLTTAFKRRLANLAKTMEQNGDLTRSRVARLKPGAKLIREWQGETHTVAVLEDGFEWKGKRWRSLSVIARKITGSHWSGPRFFGLNGKVEAGVAIRGTGNA